MIAPSAGEDDDDFEFDDNVEQEHVPFWSEETLEADGLHDEPDDDDEDDGDY